MKTLFALFGSRAVALALVLLTLVVVAPCQSFAQAPPAPAALRPPTPTQPDEPPVVWNYLAMTLVLGLACGAALIPSKRGHQD